MITLALICRDNEKTLPRLFESLSRSKCIDGIVACDTGSTDSTIEILWDWGATVVHRPWDDHYSNARNAALEAVDYPNSWILSLDSDEWVTPDFGTELRKAIDHLESTGQHEKGISVWMRSVMDYDGYDTPTPIFCPRVFKKLPNTAWKFRIHEQIARDGVLVDFLPNRSIVADHDGYRAVEMRSRGKLERNLRLLTLAVEEEPDEPWHRYNRGECLYGMKLPAAALLEFEKAVALFKEQKASDRIVAVVSHMRVVACMILLGRVKEAIEIGEPLVSAHPSYVEGLCQQAQALTLDGQYYKAAQLYERAGEIGRQVRDNQIPYMYFADESLHGWRSALYCGRSYAKAAEYVRAIECYADAVALHAPVVDPIIESAACFAAVSRRDLAYKSLADADAIKPGDPRVANVRQLLDSEADPLPEVAIVGGIE